MYNQHDFDEIRPYRNDEFVAVIQRLLADPVFNSVLSKLYNDPEKISMVKAGINQTTTIEMFQRIFMVPLIHQILKETSKGLTSEGMERLDPSQRYLFVSNHRDIILDSALLNVKMFEQGFNPTEIAIGSNLLIYQWIADFVRINRSFIVKRNIPVKQMLEASKLLSAYIRTMITSGSDSIWIAQREGRSKDGNDQTQPALLKMLNMSNTKSFEEGFKELKIVPMAISYEIEPCGNEKVAELKKRQDDPDFKKTEKDDLMSMASGLKNQKGRIHIQFGQPITDEVLARVSKVEGGTNEQLKALAEIIDIEIYKNYRLYPNNYIAYDLYTKTDKYSSEYSDEQKNEFLQLTHQRLQMVNEDREESMQLWLRMYATPVVNFEEKVI